MRPYLLTPSQFSASRARRWVIQVWLWLLVLATGSAAATPFPTAGPPAAGPSLATALNPDGTLRPGATGSFDARLFTMRTAPDGRPVFRPTGAAGAGDERWQNGFGLPNGTNGFVEVVVQAGSNVYIGGEFSAAGDVVAHNVARWNGTAWSPLGTGVSGILTARVSALAVANSGDVYAGGNFAQAGGRPANSVARWNGTAWSALGTGVRGGTVSALAVAGNGDVYVGGSFIQTQTGGGGPGNGVARWNGTAWSPLGTGVDGNVATLAVAGNGDVYAGGLFAQAGGVTARNVARWNGTAWNPLGTGPANGVDSDVYALAVTSTGDVYAGGRFTEAGGAPANHVARWNGTAWDPLGTGSANGTNNVVRSLAVTSTGEVYAGGDFFQAGGAPAEFVARWNGTAWNSLGTGSANGTNNVVRSLVVTSTGEVYASGSFTRAGGAPANRVVRWNGAAWSPLGANVANGINRDISALVVASNGDVYAGGGFTQAGGVAANGVARWNGTAWASLGTGPANGVSGFVEALALAANGDLYVGGGFTRAGGVTANGVARWNGTAWSPLGAGVDGGGTGIVRALVVAATGDLYVGGDFTQAGGVAANGIARWNGTAWASVGTGVNADVLALIVASNGDVYAGGDFTQAGGAAANRVARWNGTAWSALGTGLANGVNGAVLALALTATGDLYAGGFFTQAGGATANRVARWNGTTWASLGTGPANGVNDGVYALAVAGNGDLYVGGDFIRAGGAGGVQASNVARWNGSAWAPLGTGLNNDVRVLAAGPAGQVYVGGYFSGVGDDSKVTAGFGVYDPAAPLAVATPARPSILALYPNPARTAATLAVPAAAQPRVVRVYDTAGHEVRRQSLPARASVATLELAGLPAGVYTVRVGTAAGRLIVQ